MERCHARHHHRQARFLVARASLHPVTGPSAVSPDITKSIVNHVQTSLARAPYNIDDFGAYQSAALSVRDNLIVSSDLLGCLKMRLARFLLPDVIARIGHSLCMFLSHFHVYVQDPSHFSSFISITALCTYHEIDVLCANISQSR
jgi:hypothetical protein